MSRTFTDRYGTELGIGGEASFAGCARVTVSKPCGVHVEAADFPALIAALHEAAGLPAPVILERPALPGLTRHAGGCKVFADGGAVRLQATERVTDGRAYWFTRLTPGTAREVASLLAAMADAVEAEPDPDDVTEMAEEIREALAWIGGRPDEACEIAARAALRWFAGKQQRGGERDA